MRIASSLFLVFALAIGPSLMLSPAANAQVGIMSVAFPPPPLPIYEQPPIPGPGTYIWTPGYWGWDGYEYFWVPGTWVLAPRPGLLWTPGYWGWNDGAYLFHEGYWGPHIGFYGGVTYGFGYTGVGYEGGYWNNGNFFYNRAVNNITNVNITSVYDKNVVMNPSLSNVSYNGGAGGIVAQPRPEELAAEREARVAPTPLQVEHVQVASKDRSLFATTNHGVPPIAATANPGVLKGVGVVPAKAAGSVEPRPPAGEHALTTPQSAPAQGEREGPHPAAPQVERETPHPTAPQLEREVPSSTAPQFEREAAPPAERAVPRPTAPPVQREGARPAAPQVEREAPRREPPQGEKERK